MAGFIIQAWDQADNFETLIADHENLVNSRLASLSWRL
jgi:hypothetical protein